MSSVTDAIKSEIQIMDYAQKCGYTLTKVGRQYSLREHDSVRIDPERNVFFRHSTGQGGSVIDFAMWIHNVDQAKAISMLRGELTPGSLGKEYPTVHPDPKPKVPTGPLKLPPKVQGKYRRVYAYLVKARGIDREIVTDLVNRRQLYEDERHNCVFVGFDKDSVPAFACARGTSTFREKPFRRDFENSRKEVGWYVDNQAARLFVCEAPIDAMSLMTLLKQNKMDYRQFDYLAVSGMCYQALPYHLERPGRHQLKTIYLATDNDEKGHEMRKGYREQLLQLGFSGKIIDKVPLDKDWNKDLCNLRDVRQNAKQLPNVSIQRNNPKAPKGEWERSIAL